MINNADTSALRNRILPAGNLIGLVMVIIANTLAVTLPLNGKSTGALSDQYPNLFVPAGLTFSIWSVIYLSLIAFTIYQLTAYAAAGRRNGAISVVTNMGWLFIVSCVANTAWIFSWHYELLPLSIIIMLVLLATLISIILRFGMFTFGTGARHELLVQLPFSIYLGWISIATIANATALLVNYGWDRWGISEIGWTVIMIVTGGLITLLMIIRRNNFYYSLPVLWAFYGIMLKRQQVGTAEEQPIITICIAMMVVIAVAALWKIVSGKKKTLTLR